MNECRHKLVCFLVNMWQSLKYSVAAVQFGTALDFNDALSLGVGEIGLICPD